MGGAQSIGFKRTKSERPIHVIQSSFSWALAFLISHALVNGSVSSAPSTISVVHFGIVGWGVIVVLTVWAIIGFAPTHKQSYPRGHIRW